MPEMEPEEQEASLSESIGRVLQLAIRHRWWILSAVCATTLGTIAVLLQLPNRYTSEASLIVQQQVLQRYVLPSTVAGNLEIVEAIARQVLSRAHLIEIINQFNLYEKQRKTVTPDALIELMRKDISIASIDPKSSVPRTDFSAFGISFSADDPQVAQMVAGRLTQLFVDENLKARENRAASTSKFLGEQIQTAKQRLAEQEQRLRDFKAKHPGELAEHQSANLAALSDLRIQLQGTRSSLSRAQQQRASLESSARATLARLQSERTALLDLFTPRHPNVMGKDLEIAQTEAVVKLFAGEASETQSATHAIGAGEGVLAGLVSQLEANRRETEDLSRQEARLRSEVAQYENRMNQAPAREQELAGILRDYDLMKQQYTDLLIKGAQSQLAASLEESRESLEFRLVDPPSFPLKPSSPKRLKTSLASAAAGIFLGIVLSWFAETKRDAFHSEKSVRQRFPLPLVLAVPLLLTPAEVSARRWRRAFEWVAGCVIVLAVSAAEFYVYLHG